MKTLILSVITILFSWISFSQTITLSEKQAKAVAIDLVKGKACAEELDQVLAALEITETKVAIKEKVIANLENQKIVFIEKDIIRTEQIKSQDLILKDTEKILKKSGRTTTFYKIVAVAALIASGTLLIVK